MRSFELGVKRKKGRPNLLRWTDRVEEDLREKSWRRKKHKIDRSGEQGHRNVIRTPSSLGLRLKEKNNLLF